MFQVRIVFHTWKNGLQLFCKTGNVRNQYRPAKATCGTVKILQNAFSHIMFLCPQRSDRAEKPETRNTRFSRQCALKTLLSGFGLKAFRKFTMKSAWGNIPDWCREGKPLFHPKHKPGIFCHTLSYCMTKMEIKLLTYRSLRRSVN